MTSARITNQGVAGPHTTLDLDGNSVSHQVCGLTLDIRVGSPPLLTLDIPLNQAFEFTGDVAIRVDPSVEDLLLRLGWTPPPPQ